ncbi:MAG: CARDB domain-containing protein [Candidatus Thermoplasmatota archaeon]
MLNQTTVIKKVLSFHIGVLLLLGLLAPIAGAASSSESGAEPASIELEDKVEIQDDTWVIDGETEYLNGTEKSEFIMDSNILITNGGRLEINNATLTLTIDGYHPWSINLEDNSELALWNSGIGTQLPEGDVLRPFLKTEVVAESGSSVMLRKNSSFTFPGWVRLYGGSELMMKDSTFDALEEVPDFDYTWGYGDYATGMRDNENCPMLISEDSEILLQDSEINDYYTNTALSRMDWYASGTGSGHSAGGSVRNPVVAPGETMHIDEWTLLEDQMDFPAKDYPYTNPIDRITSLYLVAEYEVGEDYGLSQPLEYRAPGGTWQDAAEVDVSGDDIATDVWELQLDQFYRDEGNDTFWHDMELRFDNGATGNASVGFEQLNLISAYENDIRLEDSDMTVINSFIDIDFEPADVDPRDTTEPTTPDTYLQDSNQEHRVIRAYGESELKTYGLVPAGADEVPPDGDPCIIETADSTTEIYRWAHVRAEDNTSTPVVGAEISSDFDDFDPTEHIEALDYRDINYPGEYDGGVDYTTGENGITTMIMRSDILNYPTEWPNSGYEGSYSLDGTYQDDYIGEQETSKQIGLPGFPTLTTEGNNPQYNMTFDMKLPLPNFNVYDGDLTVDGDADPGKLVVNQTVLVSLDVRNEGQVPAENILVEFHLDDQLISDERIDLEGGAQDTIEFEWTPQEENYGTGKMLTAEVDPYNEIGERDRDNNEVSLIFDIAERPDLRVEQILLDGEYVEGNNVMEGGEVDVSAEVTNQGETAANDVVAEISVVSKEDGGSSWLGDEIVSLEPGEVEQIGPFTWEGPEAGEFAVKGEIDPDGEVDESDNRYNVLERDVSALSKPNLKPEELHFSEDPVRIGENVDVTARIINEGEWTSEEITVNFYVDDKDEPFASRTRGGMGGGTTREITVEWTAEMTVDEREEMRQITAEVEPDPNEGDQGNLELSEEITIERLRALIVEDITVEPEEEAIEGEPVEVTATVRNAGDMGVDHFEIILRSEKDGEIDRTNWTEGLIIGQSVEISFIWDTSGAESGIRELAVEIPDDDTETVPLRIRSPPNLEFVSTTWEKWDVEEEAWIELDENGTIDLEEMDDLRFNATIENTGDTALPAGNVQFVYPDGTWVNKSIEVGETATVSVMDEWLVETGDDDEIIVRLKPSEEPDVEPYEEISRSVSIDPLEIRITDMVIPDDPSPGETYSFEGTLTRQSDGKVLSDTEVRVALVSDGEELASGEGTTDENGIFFVTLQIPEDAGDYTVVFEPQTSQTQQVEESMTVEEDTMTILGLPLWMFIVIIAAAAGGVGSLFAYFKFYGPEEVVECGNCGASISADSTTCPKCGVEFDMDTVKCSECGEWIPATSDNCPECGAEFIKTGEEVEDYTERMRKQYERFVSQRKQEAESKLGRSLSKKEFLSWWKQQPSFVTFDEWLERKEKQRKEGGQECPECGTLNSVDDAVCQKCGTSLIGFEEKGGRRRETRSESTGEEQGTAPPPPSERDRGTGEEAPRPDQGSPKKKKERKQDKGKRVKKKPRKKVKKKVVKDKDKDK